MSQVLGFMLLRLISPLPCKVSVTPFTADENIVSLGDSLLCPAMSKISKKGLYTESKRRMTGGGGSLEKQTGSAAETGANQQTDVRLQEQPASVCMTWKQLDPGDQQLPPCLGPHSLGPIWWSPFYR